MFLSDLFLLDISICAPSVRYAEPLRSTCHYIVVNLYVNKDCDANNMLPIIWGGGRKRKGSSLFLISDFEALQKAVTKKQKNVTVTSG